ncbi:sensor histidine kinase [Pseudoalteromonas denitrificans]|uniref:histidine kinase n=1 Tax=Pseudoalteromonas denitrificans DSM 6059 TaxID=1123010 RepID=A0A1I1SYF4_9GAMM|nr:HAMP domain-containing sensor histidine kinase [Pseudoalteromonas denitrificans]SFD51477.1 Signal transduction histidine kinase [Pseudoalteromonas denitrificans DSM 6059]
MITFRKKITLAFISFAIILSTAYGCIIWGSAYWIEDNLYQHILEKQYSKFKEAYQRNPKIRLSSDSIFKAKIIPTDEIPEQYRHLDNIVAEVEDQQVLLSAIAPDTWYLLTIDESYGEIDSIVPFIIYTALIIALIVALCGVIMGSYVAKQLSAPIEDLVYQVEKSTPEEYSEISSFKNYEMHRLSKVFNGALNRVREFLKREQAFTQSVSHELRSPLMVMNANVALLENDKNFLSRALPRLKRATTEMEKLTEIFMLLAREENLSLSETAVNPKEIIEKLVVDKERLNHSNLCWNISSVRCKDLFVSADLFKIVLKNIIDNAYKYAKESVTVVINNESITFKNAIAPEISAINGSGVGIKIIERICETIAWKVDVHIDERNYSLQLSFVSD